MWRYFAWHVQQDETRLASLSASDSSGAQPFGRECVVPHSWSFCAQFRYVRLASNKTLNSLPVLYLSALLYVTGLDSSYVKLLLRYKLIKFNSNFFQYIFRPNMVIVMGFQSRCYKGIAVFLLRMRYICLSPLLFMQHISFWLESCILYIAIIYNIFYMYSLL